jgi:hypothetical protein
MARLLNYPDIHAEALHQNNKVQPLKIVTMNKRPHPLPSQSLRPIAALLPLLLAFCPLQAEDADSLDMLAPALQDVPALKTSKGMVATPVMEDDRVVGVKLEGENSGEDYLGVGIPTPDGGWHLSSFVAVEAEVENVGDGEITPSLGLTNRVIPRGYANGVRLAPGETGVIRTKEFAFSMRTRPKKNMNDSHFRWAVDAEASDLDLALFDLRKDPLERQNVASSPRYLQVVENFRQKLQKIVLGDRTEADWTREGRNFVQSTWGKGADDKLLPLPPASIPAL